MADQDDVRRIASNLPGAIEGGPQFGFYVTIKGKSKGFVWSWAERVHPKKARVINDDVLAVLVKNLEVKEMLLSASPHALFTEPHYNGFPAVLVRLADIPLDELEDLVTEAWRCRAPADVVEAYDRTH